MRALLMRTIAKIQNVWSFRRADEDLEREIAIHLALEEDYERRGMSHDEARRAAYRTLGGVEQARQAHRDQRSINWLEHTPGSVITLVAGIGANTALFTAYDAVARKPLPVSDPGRVVRLGRWFVNGWLGDMQHGFSLPEYLYCRDHQNAFADLVATIWPVKVQAILPGDKEGMQPTALPGQLVSGNYFRSFEVGTRVGRTLGPSELAR
jgi:macrolide transport system ATP-binding/permease protein